MRTCALETPSIATFDNARVYFNLDRYRELKMIDHVEREADSGDTRNYAGASLIWSY